MLSGKALLLTPIHHFLFFYFRQAEYIYNGVKSSSSRLNEKERQRHYRVMRMEDVDACCIRMFECFLEAAPQLVLQIYILTIHRQAEETWIIGRDFLLIISYYNITIIANVINNDHLRGTIKLVLVTEIYLWDSFLGFGRYLTRGLFDI